MPVVKLRQYQGATAAKLSFMPAARRLTGSRIGTFTDPAFHSFRFPFSIASAIRFRLRLIPDTADRKKPTAMPVNRLIQSIGF